jgi:hypothetical protein
MRWPDRSSRRMRRWAAAHSTRPSSTSMKRGGRCWGRRSPRPGTVWGVRTPTTAVYRILPGKSTDEGRQVLGDYRGIAVVDGFAVYKVLARVGSGLALAHC